jgi:hypothetical protein
MQVARGEHESTLLPDGTVLISGGTYTSGATTEIYQPSTQSFTPAGQLVRNRLRHTALLLSHPSWGSRVGSVLIIGGIADTTSLSGREQALETTELFDPVSGQCTQFASMAVARENHTATQLLDGRILVTGGVGRTFVSATAELLAQ